MNAFRFAKVAIILCFISNASVAQLPDSTRNYVIECVDIIKKESLYSKRIDWRMVSDTVSARLDRANTSLQAEELVIWVFQQLRDDHGMYGGIDTSYRFQKPEPPRAMSKAILEEYKKSRAVKIRMLPGKIAYYKMPAVLIGSDTAKMRIWANLLTDSLCQLERQKPAAYIIDLRLNNGGNSEPMWQALKNLVGPENGTYMADANKKILPPSTDSASLRYVSAATPARPCDFRRKLPVAVLIGPGTASSGEIMALSFSTRPRTRLFGEPSIGVANVTNGFIIQNRGYLLLTVGYIADAKKRVVESFQVEPDEFVKSDGDNYVDPEADETVKSALKWLRKNIVK